MQPTYIRIKDVYADWYSSQRGDEVDRSLVLLVIKCSMPYRDTPKLVGSAHHQNHRRRYRVHHTRVKYLSIYRGMIDGNVVLLCRQVDDIAVACSDPTVAQGLREFIGTSRQDRQALADHSRQAWFPSIVAAIAVRRKQGCHQHGVDLLSVLDA
jgi:hypothetical protein